MESRSFQVLVVAEDRKMLRRLSKFLDAFGYEVRQAAEVGQAVAALEARRPDFLIVDADIAAGGGLQLCRTTRDESRPTYTYTFLLVRDPDLGVLTNALEAGIDDFLAKPIVYGELLARLRSGARAIEFENRLRAQSPLDRTTGLPSRAILADRLRVLLEEPFDRRRATTCVMLDLDFFRRVEDSYGRTAADSVLQQAAKRLQELCGQCECFVSLGGGKFAALLTNMGESEAVDWAEQVRRGLAEFDIPIDGGELHLTASLGVAPITAEMSSIRDVMQQAQRALLLAKHSGRNCVAVNTECRSETEEWKDLAAHGKLFENTVVRDVMLPCSLVLHADDTARQAAALLGQTGLNAAPVVDDEGRLLGLTTADELAQRAGDSTRSQRPVREILSSESLELEEDETFDRLMERLINRPDSVLVAVQDGKPTGVLHCTNLASLSEPLNTDFFAADDDWSLSTDYLLVPEPCA